MEKDSSPLDTLRQLKEWLDAGTITPAEFDTLKRKLLFSDTTTPPAPPTSATMAGPGEDPLLPPPAAAYAVPAPPPGTRPAAEASPVAPPSGPALPADHFSRPIEGSRPEYAAATPPLYTTSEPLEAEADEDPALLPDAPARSPLALVLTVGGVLLLLALIMYLAFGNHDSERLTSKSQTVADTVAVRPEVGPQAAQIDLPPAAAPETVRVAPVVPPVAAPAATDSVTTAAAPAPPTAAETAAASADQSAVRSRVQSVLASYYDDLKEAPFDASQHFAPTVERFYTLQNTTPAAINDDLTKTHFPEFLEGDTQIDPASLQIGPEANDGTRVVTYLEKGRSFRQSRQQHQQTTAQVRVRLDKNYKIVYLRQERLLENTFSD